MEIVAHLTHKAAMMLKKYKLHEVATFELSNVDKKSKEGERSVRLCNFTDVYYNWAVTRNMEQSFMLATASESQIKKLAIRKGQVAITKDSETRHDIGIPTYIADDFDNTVLGYHCALITPDQSKVDVRFLNAFLNSKMAKEYFANNASGSGMRYSLPVDAIKNILLYLPELEEQKRIGHLLSLIDRKIALNREINRNLEAIARQLYDYWFVQFDFPDENGRSYKSSGGKMVWNEKLKREIPDGWEVVNLFDGVEVQYGFPFSTELFVEDETAIPVVRIRDILNGTTSAFSTEIADSKYKLAKGDLLIGMDGNFHMNLWSDDKAYLNQRSVRIRRKEDNQISALQVLFEIAPYIKAKEQNAKGSTVGHLSDKDLKGIWLLSPSSNTHFVPALTFGNIAAKLISNRNEIAALTAQRDELLPLLMNGQVSVRPRALNCDLSFMYRPVESSCRMIRRVGADGEGRYVANNA